MDIATTRSAGLRKFIPQPDRYAKRYGNFTLTTRDLEILDTVHRYRYLEARHIRALVGGSSQQITRRLQGLFHNKYLGRYGRRERMRLKLDAGAPLIAYGLEVKAAQALQHRRTPTRAAGTQPEPTRWRKEYTRRTEWFLEHQLMVSNFRCVLEIALRETPDTELVTWKQGRESWFCVTIPGEKKRVVCVAPDAYFVLRQADQVRHFFLEADRATEEHRRIVDKFVRYWWYLQSPGFTKTRGDHPRVNVIFVTTGQRRMDNLMATLQRVPKPNRAEHGGKGLFWFGLDSDVSPTDPALFLGPCWLSVNSTRHSLLSSNVDGAPRATLQNSTESTQTPVDLARNTTGAAMDESVNRRPGSMSSRTARQLGALDLIHQAEPPGSDRRNTILPAGQTATENPGE